MIRPHNRPSRASDRYPGSERTALFGVWILCQSRTARQARLYSFPISLMKNASQNGKENIPPTDKVRFGGVTASIYANEVKDMPIPLYKVTVSRTYTMKGEFKTVTSFRLEDLPYLTYVLKEAWVRIERMKQQAWEGSHSETEKTAPETTAENE